MQLISRNAPVSAGWCCAFFPDYTNTPRGSHNCWNAIHPLKCGADYLLPTLVQKITQQSHAAILC